jgi:hypothetical protein
VWEYFTLPAVIIEFHDIGPIKVRSPCRRPCGVMWLSVAVTIMSYNGRLART